MSGVSVFFTVGLIIVPLISSLKIVPPDGKRIISVLKMSQLLLRLGWNKLERFGTHSGVRNAPMEVDYVSEHPLGGSWHRRAKRFS